MTMPFEFLFPDHFEEFVMETSGILDFLAYFLTRIGLSMRYSVVYGNILFPRPVFFIEFCSHSSIPINV